MRVLSRVSGSYEDILKQAVKKKTEAVVEEVLKTLKKDEPGDFNQALIEAGAIVCVPNGAPLCELPCPFYTVCEARKKDLTSEIPVKTPKKKRKIEEKTVLLVEYGDKIAIRKRDDTGLLASLYEFPNLEGKLSKEEVLERLGNGASVAETLPAAKHIFSHVEWHMSGYLVKVEREIPGMLFAEREELKEKYPIPNAFAAYKKLLENQL